MDVRNKADQAMNGKDATNDDVTQTPFPASPALPARDSDTVKSNSNTDDNNSAPKITHTWRFWAILASLSIAGLLSAIEGTIITSALPTIIADLGGGELYLWVANAFFLSSIATLPLYGQASNILGRRWLMLAAVALFTLGSGLSGGANTMKMLIAARTVQGLGGGGINMLIELIVTDLVPLRERGKYMAIVLIAGTFGAAVGPFIGGIITSNTTWRWVFYLNVPIGGGKCRSHDLATSLPLRDGLFHTGSFLRHYLLLPSSPSTGLLSYRCPSHRLIFHALAIQ